MMRERWDRIVPFIEDFWREHRYGPSIREVMEGCDFGSTSSTQYAIRALEREGKVLTGRLGDSRTIRTPAIEEKLAWR